MRTSKRDKFVHQVLKAKNVSLEDVLKMTGEEVQGLKLSKTIRDAIDDLRKRDGKTAQEVANDLADMMEASHNEKTGNDAVDLSAEQAQECLNDYNEHKKSEKITEHQTPEVIVNSLDEDDLKIIAAKFTDRGSPSLTKKMKKELEGKDYSSDVLRDVVKAQVKVNRSKK